MEEIKPPAKHPCGSCPYRRDVPSGVWSEEEYLKLPGYDNETANQPPAVFMCHQQNGCLCAGWVGCHDMANSLGLRIAAATGAIDELTPVFEYETDVPLFPSGAEAAAHGLADVDGPGSEAVKIMLKLLARRERFEGDGS